MRILRAGVHLFLDLEYWAGFRSLFSNAVCRQGPFTAFIVVSFRMGVGDGDADSSIGRIKINLLNKIASKRTE